MRKEDKKKIIKKLDEINELEKQKIIPNIWEGIVFKKNSIFSVRKYASTSKDAAYELIPLNKFYIYLKSLTLINIEIMTVYPPKLTKEDGTKKNSIKIHKYVNDMLTVNKIDNFVSFDTYNGCIEKDLKSFPIDEVFKDVKFQMETFIKERCLFK